MPRGAEAELVQVRLRWRTHEGEVLNLLGHPDSRICCLIASFDLFSRQGVVAPAAGNFVCRLLAFIVWSTGGA